MTNPKTQKNGLIELGWFGPVGPDGNPAEESTKTTTQRKAYARVKLVESRYGSIDGFTEATNAFARACIDEAVAPALAYLQGAIDFRKRDGLPTIVLTELRKLLTGRAGT